MTLGGEGKTTALASKAQKAKSHRGGSYRLTLPGPSWGLVSGITVLVHSRSVLGESSGWQPRVQEGEGQDGEMVSAQTMASTVQGGQWGPQQQLPTWKR